MSALFDPTAPLAPTGNLRRRVAVSRALVIGANVAAAIAVAVLVVVVVDVAKSGAEAINWRFISTSASTPVGTDGGILDALLGTAAIVTVATAIAFPLALLTALYLAEFARPGSAPAAFLKTSLDLMQGLPTIVVGLFVGGLIVAAEGKETGFAGAVALAIIELPLIARSTQEILRLVPGSMREAADSLGVQRWRTLLTVVLPAAAGGILTGTILAVARAAGETAPLLVVDGLFQSGATVDMFSRQGVPNIPVTIFELYDIQNPEAQVRAWGAAFVLLVLIVVANVGARVLLARSRRRIGAA